MIRNPTDLISSMVIRQPNVNNVRTVTITSIFSNSFYQVLRGFYSTRYGMIAVLKFNQSIFDEVRSCHIVNGFRSSSILLPLTCRIQDQRMIITNFDEFVLLDSQLGNRITVRLRVKLDAGKNYNNLAEKFVLRVFYDSFARTHNYEFMVIRKALTNVAFVNRRQLAPTRNTATLKSKVGNDYHIDFEGQGTVFTSAGDLLSKVTFTFLGAITTIESVSMQLARPTLSNSTCSLLRTNTYECQLDQPTMSNFLGTYEFAIEPITVTKVNGQPLSLDQKSVLVTLEKT